MISHLLSFQWLLMATDLVLSPLQTFGSNKTVSDHDLVREVSISPCCGLLRDALRDALHFPGSADYNRSVTTYWSLRNTHTLPACVLQPKSSDAVSQALELLSDGTKSWKTRCRFAVKSGGHTPFRDAATLSDGIVIDLVDLSSKGLALDEKTITVSPASKWDIIYDQLDPYNLTVVGGRVAGVGVGGLVTGCGISYLSARYGFACDSAESFQAVLSNGTVVHASAQENADLWKALRGGTNNFAVVTAVTLQTYRQGSFWGGQTFHNINERMTIFQHLEALIDNYDPFVHFISTLVINGQMRSWFMGNGYHYTKSNPPIDQHAAPVPFQKLLGVKRSPVFPGAPNNTLRIDTITGYSREYAALLEDKKRWWFASISFGNSARMMDEFFQLAEEAIKPFLGMETFHLSLSYQPMPTMITERLRAVDSLGPIQTEGNMFNIHFALGIGDDEASKDDAIQEMIRDLFTSAEERATELGLQRDFIPLTYADSWQDPIGRRSNGTVDELLAVSARYDPRGMFQEQVPGGFKLPRY